MKFPKPARLVSVLLAILMILSFTACGSSDSSSTDPDKSAQTSSQEGTPAAKPADPMAKYDPQITVTSVKGYSDNIQKQIAKKADVLDDNIWNRAYASELGIKVQYNWAVPGTQYEQKLNVAISSNDLPDIIPCNARQFKLLVETGVATDMTQLFQDYALPFTQEMMKVDNNVGLSQATIDGKLMSLPQVGGNLDNANMLWIRADWLKNLGLEAPKTMADVFKISEAFTKNDPDQNGNNDTFGMALEKLLFGGFGDLNGFLEGYHAYAEAWVKDSSGKLVFGGVQPEMKAGLAKLAEMYKNGELDKEFSVKDSTKMAESVISGKVGMFFGQHWVPFWPLQDCKNKDPKADWKPYPIVSIDDKPATTMLNGSAGTFYVINKNMKNPEAAVKLYNYYYMKDPALSKDFDPNFHGINGELETKPDQHFEHAVVLSWYPTQNAFIHRQVKKYLETKDESILENFWIKDNYTQIKAYQDGDNKYWSAWGWSGPEGAESINVYYDDNKLTVLNEYIKADTPSMTEKGATLKQLRDETFTKIIMGAASVDEFDKYVEKWHKLGGDDITNEVNAVK